MCAVPWVSGELPAAPEVLAVYAKHAETGEIIPQALVDKIRAASRHNQGFKTTEYIAASLLDLNWYSLSAKQAAAVEDARSFEVDVLKSYGMPEDIGLLMLLLDLETERDVLKVTEAIDGGLDSVSAEQKSLLRSRLRNLEMATPSDAVADAAANLLERL